MVINLGDNDLLIDLANTTIKELQDYEKKYPFGKVSFKTMLIDESKGVK